MLKYSSEANEEYEVEEIKIDVLTSFRPPVL